VAGLRSVGLALGRRLDPAETAVEITKLGLGPPKRAGHCCILGSCAGSAYMGGQP
jgi:hypothetical protein